MLRNLSTLSASGTALPEITMNQIPINKIPSLFPHHPSSPGLPHPPWQNPPHNRPMPQRTLPLLSIQHPRPTPPQHPPLSPPLHLKIFHAHLIPRQQILPARRTLQKIRLQGLAEIKWYRGFDAKDDEVCEIGGGGRRGRRGRREGGFAEEAARGEDGEDCAEDEGGGGEEEVAGVVLEGKFVSALGWV